MTDTPALEGMQKIHAQLDELRTQVAELAKQMATVMSGGSVVLVNAFDATAVTAPPTTYTVEAAEITLQPGERVQTQLVLVWRTGLCQFCVEPVLRRRPPDLRQPHQRVSCSGRPQIERLILQFF